MTKEKSISIIIAVTVFVFILMMSTSFASAKIVKKNIDTDKSDFGTFQVTFDTSTGTITKADEIDKKGKYMSGEKVVIPSKIAGVTVKKIGKDAFEFCNAKSVKLPDTIKTIDEKAFDWCFETSLKNLPSSLEKTGRLAFFNLKASGGTMTIPNGYEISPAAFQRFCTEKYNVRSSNKRYVESKGVIFNKSKTAIVLYPYASKRTEYSIPNGVKKITYPSFEGKNLHKVNIPKSVKLIGKGALSYNEYKSFHVSKKNKYYSSKNGIIYNKKKTKLVRYPTMKSGRVYTVPKSVTTIAYPSLKTAEKLEVINVPSSVKKIEKNSFNWSQTIYCKKGSYAEKYCKSHDLDYVSSLKQPTIKAAKANGMKVNLKWSKVKGRTKYEVYKFSKVKNKYVKMKSTTSNSAVLDLKYKGTYRFKVRAYHKIGKERIYSPYSKYQEVQIQ